MERYGEARDVEYVCESEQVLVVEEEAFVPTGKGNDRSCFGGNTTYKGQRYMQSGDEEFGEGNVTCFTRKYTVAPGSSKTTPYIPVPEAEVDRICVTREHAACVVTEQGGQVSLPVGYLEEGVVLCDQSVVSDLAR